MRKRSQLFDHIQHPHEVPVLSIPIFLFLKRPVVLFIQEAVHVGAHQLAAVADVVEPITIHVRRRADPLIGPVVDPARGQLVMGGLP